MIPDSVLRFACSRLESRVYRTAISRREVAISRKWQLCCEAFYFSAEQKINYFNYLPTRIKPTSASRDLARGFRIIFTVHYYQKHPVPQKLYGIDVN